MQPISDEDVMPPSDKAMPLTARERRQLEEIEAALKDGDPAFAKISITTMRRRGAVLVGSMFAVGLIALMTGVTVLRNTAVAGVLVGMAGFVVMVWAVTLLPHFRSSGNLSR